MQTATKGFSIAMWRERSGWKIEVADQKTGYRHDWPKFPTTLEDAKIKSLLWLEDAFHHLRTMEELDRLNTLRSEVV